MKEGVVISMKKIAAIGMGDRLSDMLKSVLKLSEGQLCLTAISDIKSKDELKKGHQAIADEIEGARLYPDYKELLDNEELDGIMVGTRCSLHSRIAKAVIEKGIPMFLEKPVSTTMEDWRLLRDGYEKHDSKTVVSFPLRVSPVVTHIKSIIDSGQLGRIEHVQAFNYVPYGGVYYHNWYRDINETGGLFLQKATHDFDYINRLLGFTPTQIYAAESTQIFTGNKPAGLKCKDCGEYKTCQDSPYVLENYCSDVAYGDMCCFCSGSNHDSATVIVKYDTGMHMSYTQNFFARKSAAKRGAILSGYKGSVEFDWFKDAFYVYPHHSPRTEKHSYDKTAVEHFGGDELLTRNFIGVVMGTEESVSPLKAGLMSALMCLKAKESAEKNMAMDIDFDM